MAEKTDIEWCDSTLNLMAGCDGCELWNRKAGVQHCYAGTLTDRYKGRAGWPKSFEEPDLFLDRLNDGMRWGDMRGAGRPGKPWLNGLPRMIFLDDMGDTFTESLPLDWLAQPWGPTVCPKGHKRPRVQWLHEVGRWCCSAAGCGTSWAPRSPLDVMSQTPHVFMLLTKRARRMREFSEKHPLPANVWPGVSVTTSQTLPRVGELLGVQGGGIRWVSAEPLLGGVTLERWLGDREDMVPRRGVGFVIVGGESGPGARPCHVENVRSVVRQCKAAAVPCFVKQLGSNPVVSVRDGPSEGRLERLHGVTDRKGGDLSESPADLRIREFPGGA